MLTTVAAAMPLAAIYALLAGHPAPALILAALTVLVVIVATGEHRHPSTDHYPHATDPQDVTP